ncbi:AraC family transcriptional regulator [uncultured Aquimarina sp.]|uniref:AraC family transcriptional regulator n=1 Tax=uncultured Aquimarina sp. TaxID=575652 RepID=UPI002637F3AB|nr:AraC family transcriptional regulator [uncultured Aquimarina sp.]
MFKRSILFLISIMFFHNTIQSQTSYSDSIGIKKVKELQKVSETTYRKGDFELYKKYVDSLQLLAKEYNLLEEEILAVVGQGIYYSNIDVYDESLKKYLNALDIAKELPEGSKIRIIILVNLGNMYNNLGQYDKASHTFKKVIRLAKTHENPERVLIASYNALGITAMHQKKYEESLVYSQKVDSFATELSRNDLKITALNNMADSYVKLDKYEEAISTAEQALKLITAEESIESKAESHLHIGVSFIGLNKLPEGIHMLTIAQEIAKNNQFLELEMHVHEYLAKAYELKGDLKKSVEEHKKYKGLRDSYLNTLSEGKRIIAERELEEQTTLLKEQKKSLSRQNKEIIIYGSIICIILILGIWGYFFNRRISLKKQSTDLVQYKQLLENENQSLRTKLNAVMKRNNESLVVTPVLDNSSKYQNSSLSPEDRDAYAERILQYMEEQKPYLNEDLKQSDLAEALNMNIPQISEVLNVCFQKNFNNFLNLYRINEVKKLMKNPNYEEYKIVAIGYEAGFKSKTSFNRAFKNLVGLTPSEYRKKSA